MWKCRSDPVLHIDLRRWADLMLVAPLDANTLGKVASGICDNLLVSDSAFFLPGPHSQCAELQDCLCMGCLPWNSLWWAGLPPGPPALHLVSPVFRQVGTWMDSACTYSLRASTSHLPLDTLSFVHGLPFTCSSVGLPAWPHCLSPLALPSLQDLDIHMCNLIRVFTSSWISCAHLSLL